MFQLLARKSDERRPHGGFAPPADGRGAVSLAVARVAVLIFPFRVVAARLGDALPPAEGAARMAKLSAPPDAAAIATDIGWAVRRTADYVPSRRYACSRRWRKALCSAAAGSPARSIRRCDRPGRRTPMKAHAWLRRGGGQGDRWPFDGYTEVACSLAFPRRIVIEWVTRDAGSVLIVTCAICPSAVLKYAPHFQARHFAVHLEPLRERGGNQRCGEFVMHFDDALAEHILDQRNTRAGMALHTCRSPA